MLSFRSEGPRSKHSRLQRQGTDSKMIFRSRVALTMILAAGCALALITATVGDGAHA
jgi:hypothetical protein